MAKTILTDPWANRFVHKALPLIRKEFSPQKVIIFGSRAKGKARKESDLDVILVSSTFKDVKFLKRMPMVLRKIPFPKHIDYICYTPEELESLKDSSIILDEALKEGIEVS
ncbi:MAG: nucleotidyltransferase domain-containing protein [Actinomycetota bacterium]|nr:nucleotidyltransferase domain-containing protein [Actinomycetota bacterium]MDI6822145.1 nucleotidyltransferase domain-containing protein [Actinomycetota bacterium]